MGAATSRSVPWDKANDLESLLQVDAAMVEDVLSEIQDGNVQFQMQVLETLTRLAADDDAKMEMLKRGVIYVLSALGFRDTPSIKKQSAAMFAHLAVNDFARKAIVAQNGLTCIVHLAAVQENDIRIWAVWTLASLAETDSNKSRLVENGVLDVLYDLAFVEDQRIKGYVAATLANLAKKDQIKDQLVSSGGVSVIVELCRSPEVRVQSYAAAALANLCSKDEHKQPVVAARGLEVLKLLAKSIDEGVQCFVSASFASLSKAHFCQHRLVEEVGLGVFIHLLRSENIETSCYAALAIANVARNDSLRYHLAPTIEALVALLRRDNTRAKSYANAALSQLAKNDQHLAIIQRVGGDEIVRSLRVNRPQRNRSSVNLTAGVAPSEMYEASGMAKVLFETQQKLETTKQELLRVSQALADSQQEVSKYRSASRQMLSPSPMSPSARKTGVSPMPRLKDQKLDSDADEWIQRTEVKELRDELQHTITELDKVQQQYESTQKQLVQVQQQLHEADESVRIERVNAAQLAAELESTSALLSTVRAQLRESENTLQEVARQHENMTAEQTSGMRQAVEGLRTQLSLRDATVARLESELAMVKETLDALRLEHKKVKAEADSLRDQVGELRDQVAQRDAEIADSRANSELAVQQRTTDLSRQLREAQLKLLTIETTYERDQSELRLMRGKLESQNDEMEDLARRYRKELRERKLLFNKIQEIQGNIRVYCRVRPLSTEEIREGLTSAITYPEEEALSVFDAEKHRRNTYEFERVFTENETQLQVFQDAQPLITSAMDGYNVCIFAYGQTGSGKTFTMEGPKDNPGVNFRALNELFRLKIENAESFDYRIDVSLLEIYNESIKDLLCDPSEKRALDLKQAKTGGFYVPDLVSVTVESADEILDIMDKGRANRASATTKMNEHSSRSHSILQITINARNKVTQQEHAGKLNLVDLAGSERINMSGATGDTLTEAININKSLSALGDVIASLSKKTTHIPYRNSKLTQLLQDSLSADSKALMFVQISPNPKHVSETVCSLAFASRVRTVELNTQVAAKSTAAKRSPSSPSMATSSAAAPAARATTASARR